MIALRVLALAACAACATTPPPAPPAVAERTPQRIDFSRLFAGRSSSSIYDPRLTIPHLMDRVLFEPASLVDDDADKGIEAWTRRKLLQALGQRGTLIIAPPPQSLPEGAVVAVLQELAVLDPPAEPAITVDLPPSGADDFCAAIAAAYEAAPGMTADDARFDAAARLVLEAALAPLYPANEVPKK